MNEALKLNLPKEIVIKILTGGGGGLVTVDNYLSLDSENPVQNKVITKATNDIIGEMGQCITQSDLPMYLLEYATNTRVDEVEGIAKGRATGYVFDTVDDLDVWLSDSANTAKLNLGDNFYIRALDVPDYWWDGEQKQQLETQKVNLPEITEALNQKQDKKLIMSSNGFYTVVLYNNQEVRQSDVGGNYTIVLMPGENGFADDYESYATFNVNSLTVFAETTIPYIIKFVGDDCNANYEFTPQPDTWYEVGFKYMGKINDKHVLVARVGAF